MSNTWCLFVDVEMSFKIWDTIYPLVNTCKQMNIQICMCSSNNPGWVGFFLFFFFWSHLLLKGVECLIIRVLLVSVMVISVGGGVVSEHRNFLDHCATNYLFFVVAFSKHSVDWPPPPQPTDAWSRVLTLWTLNWWFVICAVVIYPSYFLIFTFSPQVTFFCKC